MTTLYLLNSAVLPAFGHYSFEGPLTIAQAQDIASNGFVSAIGHEGAAALLGQLLDQPVLMNRKAIKLVSGDQAIVLRLGQRLPEGKILDYKALLGIPFELGLLTRLN